MEERGANGFFNHREGLGKRIERFIISLSAKVWTKSRAFLAQVVLRSTKILTLVRGLDSKSRKIVKNTHEKKLMNNDSLNNFLVINDSTELVPR